MTGFCFYLLSLSAWPLVSCVIKDKPLPLNKLYSLISKVPLSLNTEYSISLALGAKIERKAESQTLERQTSMATTFANYSLITHVIPKHGVDDNGGVIQQPVPGQASHEVEKIFGRSTVFGNTLVVPVIAAVSLT